MSPKEPRFDSVGCLGVGFSQKKVHEDTCKGELELRVSQKKHCDALREDKEYLSNRCMRRGKQIDKCIEAQGGNFEHAL